MKEYEVFISYSRKDYVDENRQVIPGNIISQIKELFDTNNISYWFDEEGVFSGDAFAPVIARNIKSSKIFLYISSENSNASEWTSNEIATAHAYKKKIIPFRYDDSVYNDSVIIYIARLDYIDYMSNPSKALPRLLLSIQAYLKEEADKKEQERQEETRRRHAEVSRQERIAKLQGLREKIKNLESRKFDIEKEILLQEKSLTDLRNEKHILEANIADIQEEEAILLGYNRATVITEDAAESPNKKISEPHKKNSLSNHNSFVREWAQLKSAMALKHWSVNIIYVSACLSTVFLAWLVAFIGIDNGYEETMLSCAALSGAGVSVLLGLYRIMKNQVSGIAWLFVSLICANIITFTTVCYDYNYNSGNFHYTYTSNFLEEHVTNIHNLAESILLIDIFAFTLLLSMLFIRKNGQSAWELLQKQTKSLRSDKLYLAYIVSMAFVAACTILNYAW